MHFDTTTLATLSALIVSIVGVFKFLIPEGPNQNSYIRLMSALVGTAVFTLAEYALPGSTVTLKTAMHVLLPAAAEGFTAGAGLSAGVKAYHVAQDRFLAPTPLPALTAVAGLAPLTSRNESIPTAPITAPEPAPATETAPTV